MRIGKRRLLSKKKRGTTGRREMRLVSGPQVEDSKILGDMVTLPDRVVLN